MDFLFTDGNLAFGIALALLLLLAIAQLVGAGDLFGDADADFDVDADADVGGFHLADGLISLIGFGRLPFLMWLSLLLAIFSLLGLTGQEAAESFTGSPFPALPAAGLALIAALPVTGLLARPLARILPHDETTAVPIESLLGKRGHIEIGRATAGSPARAAVRDIHDHVHHVMVEPHETDEILESGDEILLVRREDGRFFATLCSRRLLAID